MESYILDLIEGVTKNNPNDSDLGLLVRRIFNNKKQFSTYINYSGAAIGSDSYWESIGKIFGIGKQVNYTVETLSKLTETQLFEVEQEYLKVAKQLGRPVLDKDTYVGGLVRRSYLQAKAADAIFAIGQIIEPDTTNKDGYKNKTGKQIIDGGTAYAVQWGINQNKPVYVFDQKILHWFRWNNDKFLQTDTPVLTKKFAGIGTRNITNDGINAIINVYKKSLIYTITDQ